MAIKQAQCKLCRREGMKLMLKGERCESPKCAIIKRNFPPGISGGKGMRAKKTEYGIQLREKQKAKRIYGVYEGQFKKYYEKAMKAKTGTAEKMISNKENVVNEPQTGVKIDLKADSSTDDDFEAF